MLCKVYHAKRTVRDQVFYRREMGFLAILSGLCFCLSIVLKPCASMQLVVVQEHSTPEPASAGIRFSQPALPRKLRILEQVKGHGGQGSVSYNEQKGDISDNAYKKQQNVMMRGARGTWKQWAERTDTSEFFRMDYSHVSRRSPIHNKSLPVGP